jgi:glycosyltransferase involved in cell wall biosynthesis
MITFSVIMPVYNVEDFVAEAITSVLQQTFSNFELIIVNDCATDNSLNICQQFKDPRISLIQHNYNRGLAGARNTGIRHAQGEYLAFLDSDDTWAPEKLSEHFEHLKNNPDVGLSFSRSAFIEADGTPANCYQMPRFNNITAEYLFCHNPIGNGSAPVVRASTMREIRFFDSSIKGETEFYFDESFRRSEDIECWLRIALTTNWKIEGIRKPLTNYRLNAGGLSASLFKQFDSWKMLLDKTYQYAPGFAKKNERKAKAYQLRYLARQAIRLRDGKSALLFWQSAFKQDFHFLIEQPAKSLITFLATYLLWLLPSVFIRTERLGMYCWGMMQKLIIKFESA